MGLHIRRTRACKLPTCRKNSFDFGKIIIFEAAQDLKKYILRERRICSGTRRRG
jgi:hypothetical protein